jgi:hypothetical protein
MNASVQIHSTNTTISDSWRRFNQQDYRRNLAPGAVPERVGVGWGMLQWHSRFPHPLCLYALRKKLALPAVFKSSSVHVLGLDTILMNDVS